MNTEEDEFRRIEAEALRRAQADDDDDTQDYVIDKYTYETYGTARFHIPEGFYSIEEIEKLLFYMKATNKQTKQSLKRVIKPLKERNHD